MYALDDSFRAPSFHLPSELGLPLAPIIHSVPGDLQTPISAYLSLAHGAVSSLFTVEQHISRRLRYTIVVPACDRFFHGYSSVVPDAGPSNESAGGGSVLHTMLRALRRQDGQHTDPASRLGGWLGIQYPAGSKRKVTAYVFLCADRYVAFEHLSRRIYAVAHASGKDKVVLDADLCDLVERLRQPPNLHDKWAGSADALCSRISECLDKRQQLLRLHDHEVAFDVFRALHALCAPRPVVFICFSKHSIIAVCAAPLVADVTCNESSTELLEVNKRAAGKVFYAPFGGNATAVDSQLTLVVRQAQVQIWYGEPSTVGS